MKVYRVVVPIYFLVWYNRIWRGYMKVHVVVPIYFLVWYNFHIMNYQVQYVVVPIYFLVWYNRERKIRITSKVVRISFN